MAIKPVGRTAAVKALMSLEAKTFGCDKGSGEMYAEWAAACGLCQEWDGEGRVRDECLPPNFWELLLAVGVSPQEILAATHINPACFPPKMCQAYGFQPVRRRR